MEASKSDDLFENASSTVLGKTPYAFLQEVTVQNQAMSIDAVEREAFLGRATKTFVSTITIYHSPHENVVVTGPPAVSKQMARHAAAVEVFRRLRLNKSWLLATQVPLRGGKKWKIPDESFLPIENLQGIDEQLKTITTPNTPPPSSVSTSGILRTPPTSPTKATAVSSSPASPSSYISTEWILRLIAYCSQKKLSPPAFTEIAEEGPTNMRVFTIQCEVRNFTTGEVVTSKVKARCKKQIVKQFCAQSVLMKLKIKDGVVWDEPPMPDFVLEVDDIPLPCESVTDKLKVLQISNPPSPIRTPQSPKPTVTPTLDADTIEEGEITGDVGCSDSDNDMENSNSSSESVPVTSAKDETISKEEEEERAAFRKLINSQNIYNFPNTERIEDAKWENGFEGKLAVENPLLRCTRPFEECVKWGAHHYSHAVIRDLTMDNRILNELKNYESVSPKRAVGLLDELVKQQPVLPKQRTNYLERLRGNASFEERGENDHLVSVDYQRLHSMHIEPRKAYTYEDLVQERLNVQMCLQDLDNLIFKGEICVVCKFHHQTLDFTTMEFGSTFEEGKVKAAKSLVDVIGQLCVLYR